MQHAIKTEADIREWVADFKAKHGRPPRILHVSNIANNAYINAKIQRRYGIEADAFSNDYYHFMGIPEWEDGTIVGEIEDQNFPDLSKVKVKGFRRPRWFVNGAYDACIRYLLAYKSGKPILSFFLWHWLKIERGMLCGRNPRREYWFEWIEKRTGRKVFYAGGPVNAIMLKYASEKMANLGEKLPGWMGWLKHKCKFWSFRLQRAGRTADICNDQDRHRRIMARHEESVREKIRRYNEAAGQVGEYDDLWMNYRFHIHPYLRLLYSKYDIVQHYATWTKAPFMMEWPNYFAYEHGTLRDIPWAGNDEARMCLASYNEAARVCITNTDVVKSARRMGLKEEQMIFLPHAYDDTKIGKFLGSLSAPDRKPYEVPHFIAPARQDWVNKKSHFIIHAMKAIKDRGLDCVLLVPNWGADLEKSKELAKELGIEDRVKFIPTMSKSELWRQYVKCAGVIDQFLWPAIGGVSFETMACGTPLISLITPEELDEFFGEAPPIINCHDIETITDAVARVITDKDYADAQGRAGQDWMQKYHSTERVVALQSDAYRAVIDANAA
jgi:glycosyltransferase involved in cell wall biosynthesis